MKTITRQIITALKVAVGLIWAILIGLLIKRDVFIETVNLDEVEILRQAESEEYQSIYFKNSKIGFVFNRYTPQQNNEILLEQEAYMNLNVADTIHTIELRLTATLFDNNNLRKFNFSFSSPFYQMHAEGEVHDKSVKYTLFTGSNTINDTMDFNSPPRLLTSRRGYLLQSELKVGEKRKIPWFDPVFLTGKESVVEYRGKESVLINGRVHNLHQFTEIFSGARVNFWLNDSGIVVKEESPAGFVFIREPKFRAMKLDGTSEEILSAVAVKIKGKMVEITSDSMQYRLELPTETDFNLNRDRQQYENGVLTINRETLPASQCLSCTASNDTLAATPYVQSEHPDIIALVNNINSKETSLLEQVRKLSLWVFTNLDKRPVLGLPDALTTLNSRKGDCNEHAALFAALGRAAGIPTRIVAGVIYYRDAFYYHAWNEVCLAGKWISIDTTNNQFPADLTHIKFIQGRLREQVRIGALLGNLSIEPLPQPK